VAVAVVTGGASGLGRALGERCSALGMDVVLLDLDGERAAAEAARLTEAHGVAALGLPTDVADAASVDAAAGAVGERFGAADLVVAGRHQEVVQDEQQASYEGWFREAEAKINWANHADVIHNLIRGCDPAPGAWTTLNGVKLQLFDSRKELVRTFGAVKGKIGEVVELAEGRLVIAAQGGRIRVGKAKLGDGKKLAAADLIAAGALKPGQFLGN